MKENGKAKLDLVCPTRHVSCTWISANQDQSLKPRSQLLFYPQSLLFLPQLSSVASVPLHHSSLASSPFPHLLLARRQLPTLQSVTLLDLKFIIFSAATQALLPGFLPSSLRSRFWACVPVLFLAWLQLGANLNHLSKALAAAPTSHALFYGSVVGHGVCVLEILHKQELVPDFARRWRCGLGCIP